MNNRNERELLVETGRELLEKNIVANGHWGNTSCRVDDEHCLITPSGLDYMQTTEEDIVLLDLKSGEWEGRRKPSGERGVHIAAYRQFPGVNFVIHTHQNYATAIGLTGIDSLQITEEEKETAAAALALQPIGLPGMKKLTDAVDHVLQQGIQTASWCIMACWSADVTKRRPWSVCSCWKRYVKETSVQLTCKAQSKRLPGRISRESLQRLWRDLCRKNIVMRRFFGRR